MKNIFTSLTFLLLGSPLFADTFVEGNFTYVTTSENTVELSVADVTDGDVVIPETVTNNGVTYTVTSIGENAFLRKSITSVDMPNSITRISSNAFQFCMQMKSVHLSEALTTIGASAFQTTRALAEINWPRTLKTIHSSAFLYSTSFTGQIWLAKGAAVGDGAFSNMSKATSLYLDGQPSDWGNNICEGCSELTKLYVNCMYPPKFDPNNTFPEDEWGWDDPVEITLYVPVGAKENYLADSKWASRFEDIIEMEFTNPDTTNPSGGGDEPDVREYETYTDTWSDDFTEAKLNVAEPGTLAALLGNHKNTVISISLSGKLNGDDILCLRNMAGASLDGTPVKGAVLKEIDLWNSEIVPGGSPYYSYSDVYYTEQDAVGNKMFGCCYILEKFVMPKYAVRVGKEAFDHAEALSDLTLNPTLESIGELAFYNCVSLEELDIPENCSSLGDMVFYTCSNLRHVGLPSTLSSIPFAAFYFCHSLEDLEIPSGVKTIENLAFQQCVSLTSVNIPAATYKISSTAFGYCMSLTEFKVDPENMDYSDIDGVLFNKNKTKLLDYPIAKPDETYEIPEGTVTVEGNAMANAGFSELVIPEGVVSLAPESASFCMNLKTIRIPASLTTMENAFAGSGAIEDYIVADGNTVYGDLDGVLCDRNKETLIAYPSGRTETSYTVPEGVRNIAVEAFREIEALETIIGSEGLETIGENAFALCSSLRKAELPASLRLISEGAFAFTDLSEIVCHAPVPPECRYYEDETGIAHPFVGVDVESCALEVPAESVDLYKETPVWEWFNIKGISSGLQTPVIGHDLRVVECFDLNGRKVGPDAKGVILCRMSDGSIVKLIR